MKQYSSLLAVFLCGFFFVGCGEEPTDGSGDTGSPQNVPTLTTKAITDTFQYGGTTGGTAVNSNGYSIMEKGVCWNTSPNPTIAHASSKEGSGSSSFTSKITGLDPNTKYFVRAYATNSKGTGYGNELEFTTVPEVSYGTLVYNGYSYKTVIIGQQEWTAENLRTTLYNDGSPIFKATSDAEWAPSFSTTPKYTVYENDSSKVAVYGNLYNWYAVNTKKLAPATGGWRVASDGDYQLLATFLGGAANAGGKIKSLGTTRWLTPNERATNVTGFSAEPGGGRAISGGFSYLGNLGTFWTTDSNSADGNAVTWEVSYINNSMIQYRSHIKREGYSVRLVRTIN